MPTSAWEANFSESGAHATVRILIAFDQLEDLEKTMEMGFKEGFMMGIRKPRCR